MAFMVVHIHAPFLLQEGAVWSNNLSCTLWIITSRVICQLAVPTFFLISGYYFFTNLENWDWKKYVEKLKKRSKTVLLPYLIWNTLFIIPSIILVIAGVFDLEYMCDSFAKRGWLRIFWDSNNNGVVQIPNVLGVNMGAGYPQDGPLWFIRDLMVMFTLSPFIYWILKKSGVYGLIVGGAFYVFNIWLPFSGFSSTSMFFFMTGAWLMMEKKEPIVEFEKIKKMAIIGTSVLLISTTFLYNYNATYYDISMRMFRIFAIPLVFLIIARMLEDETIKIYRTLSGCGFFIFAAHNYFSFRAVDYLFGVLHFGFLNQMPFIKYLSVASLSIIMLITLKLLIDKYLPKLSNILNGYR